MNNNPEKNQNNLLASTRNRVIAAAAALTIAAGTAEATTGVIGDTVRSDNTPARTTRSIEAIMQADAASEGPTTLQSGKPLNAEESARLAAYESNEREKVADNFDKGLEFFADINTDGVQKINDQNRESYARKLFGSINSIYEGISSEDREIGHTNIFKKLTTLEDRTALEASGITVATKDDYGSASTAPVFTKSPDSKYTLTYASGTKPFYENQDVPSPYPETPPERNPYNESPVPETDPLTKLNANLSKKYSLQVAKVTAQKREAFLATHPTIRKEDAQRVAEVKREQREEAAKLKAQPEGGPQYPSTWAEGADEPAPLEELIAIQQERNRDEK